MSPEKPGDLIPEEKLKSTRQRKYQPLLEAFMEGFQAAGPFDDETTKHIESIVTDEYLAELALPEGHKGEVLNFPSPSEEPSPSRGPRNRRRRKH